MNSTSVKLDEETQAVIRAAAKKQGVSLSEFLREAARERALKIMVICKTCGQPHLESQGAVA